MSLELKPQLPIDTEVTPFWKYISSSHEDLTFNLVRVTALHFDNMKLVEFKRGTSDIFGVYGPPKSVEILQKIVKTPNFYMLKSVVEGHALVNMYRHNSPLLKEEQPRLTYLFWLYRADHSLKLSRYWDDRSKELTNTNLSRASYANSQEYYSIYLGAVGMARNVRLKSNPVFGPIDKLDLTRELLEKVVTNELLASA